MNEIFLGRTLLYGNKYEVRSFFPYPKLIYSQYSNPSDAVNLSVLSNAYLIIKYVDNSTNKTVGYDNSKKFTMTLKNRRIVRSFFSTIASWFENSKYNSMFYYTEEGNLEVNLEFQNTKAIIPSNSTCEGIMAACPIIVTDVLGRREGVALTINNEANLIALPWEEALMVADTFINFDFSVESILLMESYMSGSQLGRFATAQEIRQQRATSTWGTPNF